MAKQDRIVMTRRKNVSNEAMYCAERMARYAMDRLQFSRKDAATVGRIVIDVLTPRRRKKAEA